MQFFSNFCCCQNRDREIYSLVEITDFELFDPDQESQMLSVKFAINFYLNNSYVIESDCLYLYPYNKKDEDNQILKINNNSK